MKYKISPYPYPLEKDGPKRELFKVVMLYTKLKGGRVDQMKVKNSTHRALTAWKG